jgi:hypothetical protein
MAYFIVRTKPLLRRKPINQRQQVARRGQRSELVNKLQAVSKLTVVQQCLTRRWAAAVQQGRNQTHLLVNMSQLTKQQQQQYRTRKQVSVGDC